MNEKRFLNEEKYKKSEKKLKIIAAVVLLIGILIGGALIFIGLRRSDTIFSKGKRENLKNEIALEEKKLNDKKTALEEKIKPAEDEIKSLNRVPFNGFDSDYYARKDKIAELEKSIKEDKKLISDIEKAISDEGCVFETSTTTEEYCRLKEKYGNFDGFSGIPFYIIGAFITLSTASYALYIFIFAKRRDILAFAANQTVPVTKEVIVDVAPSIGKAAGTIRKEMINVSGESDSKFIGEMAKSISKGIKEGINEANQNNNPTKKDND